MTLCNKCYTIITQISKMVCKMTQNRETYFLMSFERNDDPYGNAMLSLLKAHAPALLSLGIDYIVLFGILSLRTGEMYSMFQFNEGSLTVRLCVLCV